MKSKNVSARRFSEEFKLEAINFAKEVGAAKAAKELGVGYSTLKKWQLDGKSKKPSSETASYEDLVKEIRKLKKELCYMNKINEVLKKSTAIFSKDQMEGL